MPVVNESATGGSSAAIPQQALTSSQNLQAKFPTAQSFASWLDSAGGKPVSSNGTNIPAAKTLGAQFLAWYAQEKPANPQYSLGEFEYTFLTAAEFGGLGSAIVDEAEGLGSFTGTAANATVSTLDQIGNWESGLTSFLGALTNSNTWLRIAEGVLGIILIAVGLARLTHAVPIATSIAKTAGAVALA